jgi:hypothetical protein
MKEYFERKELEQEKLENIMKNLINYYTKSRM